MTSSALDIDLLVQPVLGMYSRIPVMEYVYAESHIQLGTSTIRVQTWRIQFRTMERTSCDVLREKVPVAATTAAAGGYYQ